MKLNQILEHVVSLNEEFNWDSPEYADAYKSLSSLEKYNKGVWKSTKQRWFILNKLLGGEFKRTPAQNKEYFGIDVTDDQKVAVLTGISSHAQGPRGQVPVYYAFVLDDVGVVAHHRIRAKGNMGIGAAPDPSKVEAQWTRPDNVDSSHLDEPEKKDKASSGEHQGEVGSRIRINPATLVRKQYMRDNQVAYNVTVEVWWNIYKDDDGNILYHNGREAPIEVGDTVNMAGTVSKHIVNKKGENVTTLTRPHFKKLETDKAA